MLIPSEVLPSSPRTLLHSGSHLTRVTRKNIEALVRAYADEARQQQQLQRVEGEETKLHIFTGTRTSLLKIVMLP